MKYSEEYLNDLIEILELLIDIDTRLLAYDLTNKFLTNYNININSKIIDLLISKDLILKLDYKKPVSIRVDNDYHLVFSNDPNYYNKPAVIKPLNSLLELKKKWYDVQ